MLVSLSLSAETIRLSEPVTADAKTETFGALLNTELPSTTLKALLASPLDNLNTPKLLKTKVAKVCQKKGCFFIAKEGEHHVRVAFKDYGFFIPTDASNKVVTMNAVLVAKNLTQEQAQHFNKDMNTQNGDIKAGPVYELVASSVQIPKQH